MILSQKFKFNPIKRKGNIYVIHEWSSVEAPANKE